MSSRVHGIGARGNDPSGSMNAHRQGSINNPSGGINTRGQGSINDPSSHMNTCGKRFQDGKGFCVNANHFFRKAVCALRSAAASCAAGACRFMRGGALEQGPAPSHSLGCGSGNG